MFLSCETQSSVSLQALDFSKIHGVISFVNKRIINVTVSGIRPRCHERLVVFHRFKLKYPFPCIATVQLHRLILIHNVCKSNLLRPSIRVHQPVTSSSNCPTSPADPHTYCCKSNLLRPSIRVHQPVTSRSSFAYPYFVGFFFPLAIASF